MLNLNKTGIFVQNNSKKAYAAPQLTALSAHMTDARKQTPSTVEQENPGTMMTDVMFGNAAIS